MTASWASSAIGVAVMALAACKERPEVREPPSSTAAARPAPEIAASWATETSIHDVLGRDRSLMQLIQVPRRTLPHGPPTVHPATGAAPFHVVTACGPGWCVDGLATAERRVLVPAALGADDRDVLTGGDGPIEHSWLERGIMITYARPEQVSFYVAEAHYTSGAAHSNARLACRTLSEAGAVRDLAAVYRDATELTAILAAVNAVLAEARENFDSRLHRLDMTTVDATHRDFLIAGPRSLVICLPDDQGLVQNLRVEMR